MLPWKVTYYHGEGPPWWLHIPHLDRRPFSAHVHVYWDGKFIVKWDLENRMAMIGEANRRILSLIDELESEELL